MRVFTQLLLAAWLGAALLAAAVVAPAAFAVLPTRPLAGALVGRVLQALFWSGAVVGVLTAAEDWLARRLTPGSLGSSYRVRDRSIPVLGAAVVAACLAAQLLVAPRIAAVRASMPGPVEALAASDARRVAFGRLHALSVAALGGAMLAGGAALALGARALTRPDPSGSSESRGTP